MLRSQWWIVKTIYSCSKNKNCLCNPWVLQFVGGSGPMLPKNIISESDKTEPTFDIWYSPLMATSPGKHDAVEFLKFDIISDEFPITE